MQLVRSTYVIKKFLFLGLLYISAFSVEAQNYHPEYEDDYLGWIKIYNYKGASKTAQ